jgi:hypothetical protein
MTGNQSFDIRKQVDPDLKHHVDEANDFLARNGIEMAHDRERDTTILDVIDAIADHVATMHPLLHVYDFAIILPDSYRGALMAYLFQRLRILLITLAVDFEYVSLLAPVQRDTHQASLEHLIHEEIIETFAIGARDDPLYRELVNSFEQARYLQERRGLDEMMAQEVIHLVPKIMT